MRWWTSAALAGAVLASALPASAGDDAMPIKDLRLPLERYDDGKIKTQLVAGQARVPAQGDIEAKEVRVEFYKDEAVDALMLAEDCRYNRTEGTARSGSQVRIEREGVVITGTGFECNIKDQTVKILSDVRVVLDHPEKGKDKVKKNGQ